MIRALLALLLIALGAQSSAATFYIDCGAGTNGSGTATSPFWGASATNGNDNSNLNWTNISTGDDDVLFAAGRTCTNAQLGGTAGFPNAVGLTGSAGNYIRIGVYDPATGAEITSPTSAQRVTLRGDGSTRTEMIGVFGSTYVAVNGFKCSGGSNSSGRGCIAVGANGATPSNFVTVSGNEVEQGLTPATTSDMYGITVGGTGTGSTTSDVLVTGNIVSGLRGASGAFGILVSNADRVTVTLNTVDASGFSGTSTGGILVRSSTDGRAALAGSYITENTLRGGMYGIRYAPFGATTTYSRLSGAIWTGNTITDQSLQSIYSSVLEASLIADNKIRNPGRGRGVGAGIFLGGATGFVDAGNLRGTILSGNSIQDAGQFAIHLVGVRNWLAIDNKTARCGTPTLPNTFGRCIEVTRTGTVTFPAVAATLSAATGLGVTLTATGQLAAGDVDKLVLAPVESTGVCRIVTVTAPNTATCDVLQDFSTTTLASGRWAFGNISHQGAVMYNKIEQSYGRQYTISTGSEGVGVGVDDFSSLIRVIGNEIRKGTDYGGIDVNSGQGNLLEANAIFNSGEDSTSVLPPSNVRRSGIRLSYSGVRLRGNSINCAGNAYGIAAENSTTTPVTTPAAGGINDFTNNLLMNCRVAGILGNSNDTAAANSYWGNGANYLWMSQLSFSSTPSATDLTAQTLDGASLTANPQVVGGTALASPRGLRPRSTSPLCNAGAAVAGGGTYADGRRFGPKPTIGAYACASAAAM